MLGTIVLILGYLVAVFGGTYFMEWALDRILSEQDRGTVATFRQRGLDGGEKVIGWLERFLVTTFILAGSQAAVGLVLATKTAIRYAELREARDQKIAEYILIETMLSLTWAVVVSVLVLNLTS